MNSSFRFLKQGILLADKNRTLNPPEIFGKFVHHGCDEALHGAELGVQAEEEQHEEEAAGPEGRERHLQDSAGVGQEGQAWACNEYN